MPSQPFFLLGAQRSGTTIVGLLLSRHPEICLTVNGKLLYYLITWVLRDVCPSPGQHLRLDEIAHSLRRRPILGLTEQQCDLLISTLENGFPFGDVRDLPPRELVRHVWQGVYEKIAGEKAVWGDKYNEYLLCLREVIETLPEARFLFISRSPHPAAVSMLRSFKGRPWVPDSQAAALEKWADWNRSWLIHREMIPPANRLEIRYEDLCSRPRPVAQAICEWLQVDTSREFLSAFEKEIRPLEAPRDLQAFPGGIMPAGVGQVATALGHAPGELQGAIT